MSCLFYSLICSSVTYKMYECRLCLGAWSDHGERTGGFYACNRYEAAKQEGAVRDYTCLVILQNFLVYG